MMIHVKSRYVARPRATKRKVLRRGASRPTVSIGIPALNEAGHIEQVLNGFLNAGYPALVEIIVADGGSSDGTVAIVEAIAQRDSRVKLVHNRQKVQSAGLNVIFAQAVGEVFLRADAHCEYAPDYIQRCVEALGASGALNVGGAQRFVAATPFQAAVALAVRSPLGSGGAPYRNPHYDGFADTVFLGCFKSAPLRTIACRNGDGPFDTSQITNQDAELNLRLLREHPQAVFVSSRIRVWYYPRKDFRGLWQQYFKYGRGRYLSSRRHPGMAPWRSRLPFLALTGAAMLTLLDAWVLRGSLHMAAVLAAGLVLPFLEGARMAWGHRDTFEREIWRGEPLEAPGLAKRALLCGLVLLMLPVAHCAGYAHQLVRHRFQGVTGW